MLPVSEFAAAMHYRKNGDKILLGVPTVVEHVWKAAKHITTNCRFLDYPSSIWSGNHGLNRCLDCSDEPLGYA